MAPPLRDDEFERQRRFRQPDPADPAGAERPDWLTRAHDAAEEEATPADPAAPQAPSGPPSFATGRKYTPQIGQTLSGEIPSVPGRMAGLVGPPSAPRNFPHPLDTDAPTAHGHPAHGTPAHDFPDDFPEYTAPHEPAAPRVHAPQHGAGARGPATYGAAPKRESEWEGAVEHMEQVDRLSDDGFRVTSRGSSPGPAIMSSILNTLTSSRTLVLVALAVIALVAVMLFRPKQEQTASIAAIRKHPERFEGRAVKIHGRVGEVFPVGGGYAFHLHQGREDIVVFTRSRVPVRREEVTISGSISNGTLDGKTRQALFETAH